MTKSDDEIRTILESIIRSLMGKDAAIDFDSTLTDTGLDSLKTMDLILTVEERFGIQIPDDELSGDNLRTPKALEKLIKRLLAG